MSNSVYGLDMYLHVMTYIFLGLALGSLDAYVEETNSNLYNLFIRVIITYFYLLQKINRYLNMKIEK